VISALKNKRGLLNSYVQPFISVSCWFFSEENNSFGFCSFVPVSTEKTDFNAVFVTENVIFAEQKSIVQKPIRELIKAEIVLN
jgi:hypothetical protein